MGIVIKQVIVFSGYIMDAIGFNRQPVVFFINRSLIDSTVLITTAGKNNSGIGIDDAASLQQGEMCPTVDF